MICINDNLTNLTILKSNIYNMLNEEIGLGNYRIVAEYGSTYNPLYILFKYKEDIVRFKLIVA